MYTDERPADDYEGLGFWAALIPVGVNLVAGAFGDDGSIDKRAFYEAQKSTVWCPEQSPPGADPALVAQGIDELPLGSELRSRINSQLMSDRTWDELRIARPSTALEKAYVLINWGNGWRYCPRGGAVRGADAVKRATVQEVVQVETARRRTLAARAEAAGQGAVAQFGQAFGGEIIPGVPTPILALGAAGLVALIARR